MHDIFSRHRSLALLASVVLAQVLLLAYQIKRENNIRLLRYWAAELMTPVERGGTWTFSKLSGIWTGYVDLHNARAENRQLQAEVGELRLRNRELESEAGEANRLGVLLNFREAHPEVAMLAAQVIGASADPASHTLFINRGARDHLRLNLGVITPDGVVGKLVEVFPSTSQVLLINDKESGVGALLAASRTQGVVKGTGDPNPIMDYVVNDEKVQPGEAILTSGEDRIFPKGLLIGVVTNSVAGYPFQVIHVRPATRLDRLEDVLILLSQKELDPGKTGESYSVVPPKASEPNAEAGGASKQTSPTPAAASAKAPAPAPANSKGATTPKPASSASIPAANGARNSMPVDKTPAPQQ